MALPPGPLGTDLVRVLGSYVERMLREVSGQRRGAACWD